MENRTQAEIAIQFAEHLNEASIAAKRTTSGILDVNSVAHLYGENEADLYFAQGFAHAYFRIWQMETQSRIVESRISEIIGERGVASDRLAFYFRHGSSAQKSHDIQMRDPRVKSNVSAYVDGVNARIQQLYRIGEAAFSSEYRLFKSKPREFSSVDVFRIAHFSFATATDPYVELRLSKSRAKLGEKIFGDLFPWPPTKEVGSELFGPLSPIKKKQAAEPKSVPAILENEVPVDSVAGTWLRARPDTGSNAWAYGPQSTTSGEAILANDFHMHYLLPGPYIPMQLVSRNFNAVGASRPGLLGLNAGNNGKVAWGHVASLVDVTDWYRLKHNPSDPNEYWWNGKWKKFEAEEAELPIRGAKTQTLTRRKSDAGVMIPALQAGGPNGEFRELVFRSIESGDKTFISRFEILETQTASACGKIVRNFDLMVLTCIDQTGAQGIWTSGTIPIRPKGVDPRILTTAQGDSDLWIGTIPQEKMPHVFPAKQYYGLANQKLVLQSPPYYSGWNFSPPTRAIRLDEIAKPNRKLTFDDVLEVQSDIVSPRTSHTIKVMLADAERMRNAPAFPCESKVLSMIDQWDGRFRSDSAAARLFNWWLARVQSVLWEQWLGNDAIYAWPTAWMIADVMNREETNYIWDLPTTKMKEKRGDVVRWGLTETCRRAIEVSGSIDKYMWGDVVRPVFKSVAGTPYREEKLNISGSGYTIHSQSADHGTAYRFLSTLGKKPRYWFAAMAGLEGDPENPMSTAWLGTWSRREVREVQFLQVEDFRIQTKKKDEP